MLSGVSYKLEFSNSNPYARGFVLNEISQISPTMDLVFAEGFIQVPEPSRSLVGLGSLITFWLKRPRRILQRG
jgi:hypothetical protein